MLQNLYTQQSTLTNREIKMPSKRALLTICSILTGVFLLSALGIFTPALAQDTDPNDPAYFWYFGSPGDERTFTVEILDGQNYHPGTLSFDSDGFTGAPCSWNPTYKYQVGLDKNSNKPITNDPTSDIGWVKIKIIRDDGWFLIDDRGYSQAHLDTHPVDAASITIDTQGQGLVEICIPEDGFVVSEPAFAVLGTVLVGMLALAFVGVWTRTDRLTMTTSAPR